MADKKARPSDTQAAAGKPAAEPQKLGIVLAEARKRRGLSAEDLINQTRIPAHYVRMIENDDYGLISDQLYLLPFLRRYAAFVGLDAEEVATRFVREVQRADSTGGRMAEPIAMPPSETGGAGRRTWVTVVIAAVAIGSAAAIVYFAATARRHAAVAPKAAIPAGSPAAAPTAQAAPSATVQAAPASSSATAPPSSHPADASEPN